MHGQDEEAPSRPRRVRQREASHAMFAMNGQDGQGGHDGYNGYGEDPGESMPLHQVSQETLEKILAQKHHSMSAQERAEEAKEIEFAKSAIFEATSGENLMMRAQNLIDEDWLGKIDELPGNIYRIAAFGGLSLGPQDCCSMDIFQNIARLAGALVIFAIQLCGPPAVFMTMALGIGIQPEQAFKWDQWCNSNTTMPLGEDSSCSFRDYAASDWNSETGHPLPKMLGVMFVFCFSLNGLFVILDEFRGWCQIDGTLRYLDYNTPLFAWSGEWLLYLDAFMNCWVVTWCVLDAYLLIGSSGSVKDVLYDSLSLIFLYNLDDIGGNLGFVNHDDWDGHRLGWIYDQMVKKNWNPYGYDTEANEDEEEAHFESCLVVYYYRFHAFLLGVLALVLPVLMIITPFGRIAPEDD